MGDRLESDRETLPPAGSMPAGGRVGVCPVGLGQMSWVS
jgi:hypothetical protein